MQPPKRADKNWSLRYCIDGKNVIYHKGGFVGLNLKSGTEEPISIENEETTFEIKKDDEKMMKMMLLPKD